MRSSRPRVDEVTSQDDAAIVKLAGEIDMNHSPAMHQALLEVLKSQPRRLIVDLADVSYMDSSGVGTLVDALRRVHGYGGKMALVAVAPRVLSVLQITKLDQFFEIHSTVQEALAQ